MGRKGSILVPFLVEGLKRKKYGHYLTGDVKGTIEIILPRKTKNLSCDSMKILKDWNLKKGRPFRNEDDYTKAKQGMLAALKRSDYLDRIDNLRPKLCYRILSAQEVGEKKLLTKEKKRLLSMAALSIDERDAPSSVDEIDPPSSVDEIDPPSSVDEIDPPSSVDEIDSSSVDESPSSVESGFESFTGSPTNLLHEAEKGYTFDQNVLDYDSGVESPSYFNEMQILLNASSSTYTEPTCSFSGSVSAFTNECILNALHHDHCFYSSANDPNQDSSLNDSVKVEDDGNLGDIQPSNFKFTDSEWLFLWESQFSIQDHSFSLDDNLSVIGGEITKENTSNPDHSLQTPEPHILEDDSPLTLLLQSIGNKEYPRLSDHSHINKFEMKSSVSFNQFNYCGDINLNIDAVLPNQIFDVSDEETLLEENCDESMSVSNMDEAESTCNTSNFVQNVGLHASEMQFNNSVYEEKVKYEHQLDEFGFFAISKSSMPVNAVNPHTFYKCNLQERSFHQKPNLHDQQKPLKARVFKFKSELEVGLLICEPKNEEIMINKLDFDNVYADKKIPLGNQSCDIVKVKQSEHHLLFMFSNQDLIAVGNDVLKWLTLSQITEVKRFGEHVLFFINSHQHVENNLIAYSKHDCLNDI